MSKPPKNSPRKATAGFQLQAAQQQILLDEAAFREALDAEGVMMKLGKWARRESDDRKGFSLEDLWLFYRQAARSALDARLERQSAEWRNFADAASVLRHAAAKLRWALLAVAIVPVRGAHVYVPMGSSRELIVLREAADIIDPPAEFRAEEARAGRNVMGYADQLEAHGKALKRRRGVRADPVKLRFFDAWADFAQEKAGRPLHDIGARLFKIAVGGRVMTGDDYRREEKRTNSRLRQRDHRRKRSRRSKPN